MSCRCLTVIDLGNELGVPCSNPRSGCLHFISFHANALGKDINSFFSPSAMVKIVGWTTFFDVGIEIGREGKL